MRIYTIIELIIIMTVFGIYFYFIEPAFSDNVMLRLLIFGIIFVSLTSISKKFEGYFKVLENRVDKQLSVLIVIGLLFIAIFIGLLY